MPIPIPPRKGANPDWSVLDNFNPLTVPTVIDILNEIDTWESRAVKIESGSDQGSAPIPSQNGPMTNTEKVQDYEKTALKPYVDYFKSFVAELLKSEHQSLKRERDDDGSDAKPDAMEF